MSDQTQNPLRDAITTAIDENQVILFMKGTPEAPACGFSARTAGVLQAMDVPFASVDILPDPRIREELSGVSNWPTIPQLFVGGDFVGGCDIVMELHESGELGPLLGAPEAVGETGPGVADESASVPDQGLLQPENRLGEH